MRLSKGLLTYFAVQGICSSGALACPFETYLETAAKKPTISRNAIARNEFEYTLDAAFEKDARHLLSRYISNPEILKSLEFCPGTDAALSRYINIKLPRILMDESAAKLMKLSDSKRVKSFASTIHSRVQSLSILPLRIDFHSMDISKNSDGRPAGYDRERKGLFFRLAEIKPSDWYLYLVHEFSHAFDSRLDFAIQTYADPLLSKQVIKLVQARRTYSSLNSLERESLQKYLRAGADRGLYAEFRAWVTTSMLYQDLLVAGHPEADFMTAILGHRPNHSAKTLKQIWWNYLKNNFTLKNEGLFNNPLMIEAYQDLIINTRPEAEDFGSLEIYL